MKKCNDMTRYDNLNKYSKNVQRIFEKKGKMSYEAEFIF